MNDIINNTQMPKDKDKSFENIFSKLQKEDNRNKKIMKVFFYIYIIMVIVYAALFIFNPDPKILVSVRVSGIFYVLSFSIFIWLFQNEYKIIKKVDYARPLLEVMKSAEKRYRFVNYTWYPLFVALILLDCAITIAFTNRWKNWHDSIAFKIFIIQSVYWFIMILSVYLGYIYWKVRSRTIWLGAKEIIKELEQN